MLSKRDQVTVSGNSAGGAWSCHLMWTASDTWKGAGCSKSGPLNLGISDVDDFTEEIYEDSLVYVRDLDE